MNKFQPTVNLENNQILQEAKKDIENIFEPLVSNVPHNKLPENIFKDYFLPFFADKVKNNNAMAEWVSIAGSPFSEVDIIDNSGNTIFSVPSVFDSSVISLNNFNKNNTMKEIMDRYDLESNNIPQLANNNLSNKLSGKLDSLYEKDNNRSDKQKNWNFIFERYGYINKTKTTNNDTPKDADDLIYE